MTAVNTGSTDLSEDTWELNPQTVYTLIPTESTTATITVDDGDAVEMPQNVPVVLGPGVYELVLATGATGVLIPREK